MPSGRPFMKMATTLSGAGSTANPRSASSAAAMIPTSMGQRRARDASDTNFTARYFEQV